MANTFYNRSIRKLILGFGNLFNNITMIRYDQNNLEQERFIVPIAYASKERYVMRIQDDPDLDKKVQLTLPRMSFELNGMSYDASRKQNTNTKNFGQNSTTGTISSQYNPVPYNFDFSLYLYVRNIEDGIQIIEHILPYFTPDYTIKLNMIPELGIIKEIPVVFNSVDYNVEYEGGRENDTRLIIWTLNFTVKGYIFGGETNNIGLIKTAITNVYNMSTFGTVAFNVYNNGVGNYQMGETVYQGNKNNPIASGKVVAWNHTQLQPNSVLVLNNITGNFVSTANIVGTITNAQYTFNSYSVNPTQLAKVVVTPNPITANANSAYTYTTTITETPRV